MKKASLLICMLGIHAITQTSAGQLSRFRSAAQVARSAYKNACDVARPYVDAAFDRILDKGITAAERVALYFDGKFNLKCRPQSEAHIDFKYRVAKRKAARRPQLEKDFELANENYVKQDELRNQAFNHYYRTNWRSYPTPERLLFEKQRDVAFDAYLKQENARKRLLALDNEISISEANKKFLDLRRATPDIAELLMLTGALTAYATLKKALANVDESVSKLSTEEIEQLLENARKETEMELVK